jgi:hypothetical protein
MRAGVLAARLRPGHRLSENETRRSSRPPHVGCVTALERVRQNVAEAIVAFSHNLRAARGCW